MSDVVDQGQKGVRFNPEIRLDHIISLIGTLVAVAAFVVTMNTSLSYKADKSDVDILAVKVNSQSARIGSLEAQITTVGERIERHLLRIEDKLEKKADKK